MLFGKITSCPTHAAMSPLLRCLIALSLFVNLFPASAWAQGTATQPAADSAETFEETWQVMLMRGQRIGYAHGTTREIERDGRKILINESVSRMTMVRLGQKLSMNNVVHFEESEDGVLLRFSSLLDNPPVSSVKSEGVVEGMSITVETESGGQTTTKTIRHNGPILSPAYPEKYLQEHPLQVGEKAEFEVFEGELAQMVKVTMTRTEDKETTLWGGDKATLQHISMSQSFLPGLTTSLYLDEEGELLKMVAPLIGIEFYTVDEAEALKEIAGEQLDVAVDTFIKAELPGNPHEARHATYRIHVDGADPTGLIPEGSTQAVKVVGDDVELSVTAIDPLEKSAAQDAKTPDMSEFLAATRFVPWQDQSLKLLADAGAGEETEPAQVAVALEKHVRSTITSKNFSTAMATALEVAQTKSGDCTEHSVLLAALLRAKGIPSRVAVGFVYAGSHKAFGGHMWTEAYLDDRWVPLDGTLGQGGIGVGHIKVADSSLADEGTFPVSGFVPLIHLIGRTTIEVIRLD